MEFFNHVVSYFTDDTENNRRNSVFNQLSSKRKSSRSKKLTSSSPNQGVDGAHQAVTTTVESSSSSNFVKTDTNLRDITLGSKLKDTESKPSPSQIILELVQDDMKGNDRKDSAKARDEITPGLLLHQASPLVSFKSPSAETETLSEFTNVGFTSTDTTGSLHVHVKLGDEKQLKPRSRDNRKARENPDAQTLFNLKTPVKIRGENGKYTDQFMDFLYLLLKTTLVKEYRTMYYLKKPKGKNDACKENLYQLESLIDGIMSEIIFIHENKKSHLEGSEKLGEVMPNVFKAMNQVVADQALCTEELVQKNIEEIRKSLFRPQSMHKKLSLKTSRKSSAEKAPRSKKRIEATIRKAIELGYLKDDPDIAKLLEYISDYDGMMEEMQKVNAFMKGRLVGFHLWNNALKMFETQDLSLH